MLTHQFFKKNIDLASLKSEVNKLDTEKLEKVPTSLNSLKSKVDKSGVDNKLKNLNKKVTLNKSNRLLVENELNRRQDKIEKSVKATFSTYNLFNTIIFFMNQIHGHEI